MNPVPDDEVRSVVRRALAEDLGVAGDITSNTVIPAGAVGTGSIVSRMPGTIAGMGAAAETFAQLDREIEFVPSVRDGNAVAAGTRLATVTGSLRSILTGERTALNLIGHLSGIATQVASVVAAVSGTGVRVADTRKTTPGLRSLEKYAVRCGGGDNHRFGLGDAVMIKDNHIAAVGDIGTAVAQARAGVGHVVSIEVEVETLGQLGEALEAGADIVLLDNMGLETRAEAVELAAGRCVLEASGGITPDSAAAVAATGVDVISMGWLTHSAPNLDVALDFD